MPGKSQAVHSGRDLEQIVAEIGESLGLQVERQVVVGKRIWGPKRRIDVILTHPDTRQCVGVECKMQDSPGSAEEKIPATIQDIKAWPFQGIVVLCGAGFSNGMRSYLYSTGKAVELDDLKTWLQRFFRL